MNEIDLTHLLGSGQETNNQHFGFAYLAYSLSPRQLGLVGEQTADILARDKEEIRKTAYRTWTKDVQTEVPNPEKEYPTSELYQLQCFDPSRDRASQVIRIKGQEGTWVKVYFNDKYLMIQIEDQIKLDGSLSRRRWLNGGRYYLPKELPKELFHSGVLYCSTNMSEGTGGNYERWDAAYLKDGIVYETVIDPNLTDSHFKPSSDTGTYKSANDLPLAYKQGVLVDIPGID